MSAQASLATAYSSQTVQLNGQGSSDADGTIASFTWSQVAGPAVVLTEPSAAAASFVVPPLDSTATLVIRLRVVDDDGAAASQDIQINVGPADVRLNATVATGAPFVTDRDPTPLRLTTAAFGSTSPAPQSIRWQSNVQGDLGAQESVDDPLLATLVPGAHSLTVIADFGALGVTRGSYDLRVLPYRSEPTAFQSTPAAGAAFTMPIVLINVIPTNDGVNVDAAVTGPSGTSEWQPGTIVALQSWISTITTRAKFMLEEGSRYRGYKNAAAPQVGYQVVEIYNFYESFKPGLPDPALPGNSFPDYLDILGRIPAQELIEQSGVKEIWLYGYHFGKFSLNESNMSSPATGDVSNSYRTPNDLPIFDRTYILYQNNYTRSHAEAVHNHGHQIESMMGYVNQRYDGNTDLFWRKFVGLDANGVFVPGHCGATHWPLNARTDYDYNNAVDHVQSDCEDWTPAGTGAKKDASLATWADIPYAWPDTGTVSQKNEAQWYVYWMQNLPGAGNTIPYNATTLENWWTFVGDWDAAIAAGKRLYR